MKKESLSGRIIERAGISAAVEQLAALPNQDFQSALLELFARRCAGLRPQDVLKSGAANRFAAPSQLDAASYYETCADILKKAETAGFKPVLLSPAAPLGASSVFGAVHQNNVISAARGTELLSDGTNMLALLMAQRPLTGAEPAAGRHWCSVQRVSRAQLFNGPRMFSHFGLLGMVSRAHDRGSYKTETELLTRHIGFYRNFFSHENGTQITITLKKRSGYSDPDGFFLHMCDRLRETFPGLEVLTDETPTDNKYYLGLNFKIHLEHADSPPGTNPSEIADGGFVNWTALLTGSKKERCLISGMGIDRLITC